MTDLGISKILDSKVENGQQFYQIKWTPTWEPVQNLQGCENLIAEFWDKINNFKINKEVAETQKIPLNVKIEELSGDDKNEVNH